MTDTKVQELEEKITRLQESLSKLSADTLPVPHAGADNPASIRSQLSASSASGTVTDPLVTLGTRIASVSTDDAMRLAYVRHEILRQSEISADRTHLRSMERIIFTPGPHFRQSRSVQELVWLLQASDYQALFALAPDFIRLPRTSSGA